MKTACIYHSIDLDGWISAAIVKHWFTINNNYVISVNKDTLSENDKYLDNENEAIHKDNIIEFIGYNYGQQIPDLSSYDKVIMCDISFPKEHMEVLYSYLKDNFIWCDHHISVIKDSETMFYHQTNGIRNTKFAACELTWQYFFPNETIPEIVRLLGRYDCFGHKFTKEDSNRLDTLCDIRDNSATEQLHLYQEELDTLLKKKDEEQKVLEFQYGARQCISNYEEAYHKLQSNINLGNSLCYEIHNIGKSIYQYLCTEAKQAYKNGFPIYFELNPCNVNNNVKKFICINKERFNPINFGIDYHKDGYDGAMCFHIDSNKIINVSLYNDNGLVDCSQMAKQFGGGGHKGAAGFRITLQQFIKLIL